MRREWSTPRIGFGGYQDSVDNLASALAQICDDETIRSLLDAITALDRIGGELYIGAYRMKFDPEGTRVEPDDVGEWKTVGYLFQYEHVAKRTRAATGARKEPDASFNDEEPLQNGDQDFDGTEQRTLETASD